MAKSIRPPGRARQSGAYAPASGGRPPLDRAIDLAESEPMAEIEAITDETLPAALRSAVSQSGSPRSAEQTHAQAVLNYLSACEIAWEGFQMRRRGKTTGVFFAMLPPGKTAVVLLACPGRKGVTDADQTTVTLEGMAALARRRLYYAQALLEPDDAARRSLLGRLRYKYLSSLHYLERDALYPWADPPATDRGEWVAYGPQTHDRFAATIQGTYGQSLDCPRLNGLRPIEAVMAGHRAAGRFDPRLWQLVRVDGRDAGCILLAQLTHGPLVEVVYMGVRPEFRGRRIGDLLLRRALELTRQSSAKQLTLVVDERNEPARRVYERFGFKQLTVRDAYLYHWSGPKAAAE